MPYDGIYVFLYMEAERTTVDPAENLFKPQAANHQILGTFFEDFFTFAMTSQEPPTLTR